MATGISSARQALMLEVLAAANREYPQLDEASRACLRGEVDFPTVGASYGSDAWYDGRNAVARLREARLPEAARSVVYAAFELIQAASPEQDAQAHKAARAAFTDYGISL